MRTMITAQVCLMHEPSKEFARGSLRSSQQVRNVQFSSILAQCRLKTKQRDLIPQSKLSLKDFQILHTILSELQPTSEQIHDLF